MKNSKNPLIKPLNNLNPNLFNNNKRKLNKNPHLYLCKNKLNKPVNNYAKINKKRVNLMMTQSFKRYYKIVHN